VSLFRHLKILVPSFAPPFVSFPRYFVAALDCHFQPFGVPKLVFEALSMSMPSDLGHQCLEELVLDPNNGLYPLAPFLHKQQQKHHLAELPCPSTPDRFQQLLLGNPRKNEYVCLQIFDIK
jgi:hypothetical protein